MQLLDFELEGKIDAVVTILAQVEVFHRVHLDWLLLRADHGVDASWVGCRIVEQINRRDEGDEGVVGEVGVRGIELVCALLLKLFV